MMMMLIMMMMMMMMMMINYNSCPILKTRGGGLEYILRSVVQIIWHVNFIWL